jgi:hypothetical protein
MTWRGLELIERHDRAGSHVDDLALDAEIVEHAFEQPRILLERVFRKFADRLFSRLGEQHQRRQLIVVAIEQRGLRLALGAPALAYHSGRRGDTARGGARHRAFVGGSGFGHTRSAVTRRSFPWTSEEIRLLAPARGGAGIDFARRLRQAPSPDPPPDRSLQAEECVNDGAEGNKAKTRIADGILFLARQGSSLVDRRDLVVEIDLFLPLAL